MDSIKLALVLAFILFQGVAPSHATTNVALGKPVTLLGEFGKGSGYLDPNNLPPLPPAAMVTDGIFQDGYWTNGVWWSDSFSGIGNKVVVDLQGSFSLNHFSVMVDNNDMYLLEYLNPSDIWVPLWAIPDVCCFGLMERTITLFSPITATELRLSSFPPSHAGMDDSYSVSEIQAALVPEPETYAMFLVGLVLMGLIVHRRKTS